MNDHTTNPTTNPSDDAASTALADGETRDTQQCFLKINALLMLDKVIHASVPDHIKLGIKRYFEQHSFVHFVELPDTVVKLQVSGDLGEWDGTSVRYLVDVQDEGETYEVPMLFTAQMDPVAPMDPRLERRLIERLQAALAQNTVTVTDTDTHSGTDPDTDSTLSSTTLDQS